MKKIVFVALVASVAACAKPAPTPEASTEAPVEAMAPNTGMATGEGTGAATETVAADGKPSTGTFKVTNGDGKVMMEEVKADGTYVSTIDGKVVETGKWNQKSPTEYCYTKDEAGAKEQCNVEGVDAKGVWTSKGPDGKTATVERVAA